MNGLTDDEVVKSRKEYGSNEIKSKKRNSFIREYIDTLGDPIIKILLIALAVKTVFLFHNFDWFETLGIVIAIFLASFISTLSEYGSEKAFEKLQEESSKIKVKVKRNNKIEEISIEDVVVGDIVLLESGDKIPADGIIIEGEVGIDEAMVTGESKEVYRNKIKNKVLKGTIVTAKEAVMRVAKVGVDTFYGSISTELQEKQPDSPLKMRLRHLAGVISKLGYIGAFLVLISYLFSAIVIQNNFDLNLILATVSDFDVMMKHLLYGLTLCVAIIVVAVPEGLPMMITLVLSSNMKRMLKNNVLVRKLNGIETAGSLNVLFSDKTGTITTGKLEVTNFINSELKKYSSFDSIESNLKELVKPSLLANNLSKLEDGNIIGGNTTDKAILRFVNIKSTYSIIEKVPFDSLIKYSQVVINYKEKNKVFTKGAPEVILNNCDFYIDSFGEVKYLKNKGLLIKNIDALTKEGSRIVALAYGENKGLKNMILIGFIEIKDPIRKEAVEAIKMVTEAGIQTVMITGDSKNTAISVAKEVRLYKDNDLCLTSDELQRLSDNQIKEIIPKLRIVARAIPQDKSRMVRLCQELDLVVGMTGDGVNDAPALKKSDVGFAMGSGTEVSKEASEVVILDNNFLSIAKAILFGRTAFKSIRKFIIFQLTVNLCAVTLSVLGPFIGIETPVTVIQMLWINMVMDTLAAIAFAFEPPLKEYMKEKPKKRTEPILNKYMMHQILFTGLYSTVLCILFLKLPFIRPLFRDNDLYMMTAFFGLFIFIGIFNCFNARTHRLNLIANITKNKAFLAVIIFIILVQVTLIYLGGSVFRTYGLNLVEFNIMILLSLTVIPIDFLRKYILRKQGIIGGV